MISKEENTKRKSINKAAFTFTN